MSTTIEGVDARGYLAGWLLAVTGMTVADIKAIPDDKWTHGFGGCCRSANCLLADTVTNCMWTTAVLKGESSSCYDDMQALGETFADKALAIDAFVAASNDLAEAIKGASDERLNSLVDAPWGMPTPVMTLAHISVSHVWYHDGQFNFIQSLLGDEKVHWMG